MSTFSELIDFTRSSTGTYLDSVVYGDELVTNGTFDTDSDWDKEPEWTIANGVATFDDVNNANLQQPDMGLVVGKSYLFSFEITSGATPNFSLFASGSSDQYTSYETYPVGSHQLVFTCTGGDGIRIAASRFLGSAFSIDNVSVKEIIGGQGTSGTPLLRTADTNEPRLEYDASGQPLGLLIEEQRTNKVPYSQDFTQSEWLKQDVTVATAPVAAPDGTMTATHVVKTGANGHLVDLNIVTTSDRHSIWARSVSGTGTMYIAFQSSGSLVTLTEEWQRFDVQCNGNHVYAANFRGSATLTECYIWGSQAETGTFPTSYIPTSGSTVTRNSDLAPIPVERFAFNASEGTLFVHAVTAAGLNTTTGQCAVSMSSGATANCYRLRKNVSTEEIGMLKRVGDSNVININGKIVGETSTFKACGNYSATDLNLSIDGEDVITGSASSSTITISKLDVGTSPFGDADCFNGHIKRIQYFPKRLSNDELVELTKPSSSPTMSLTFDGQATSELVEGLHD
jgi:hypothetical protein